METVICYLLFVIVTLEMQNRFRKLSTVTLGGDVVCLSP